MLATPGEVIADRFEIDRHIGAGGMGVVYRVRDRQTEGAAALKLVRHGDPQIAARFSREARLLAELVHPNIVSYIAHGEAAADTLYLAMEWLEGEDLATRMQVARLTVGETLELARQIATALAVAHRRGVVHRDIKPSNLFLVDLRVECAKLLDFGVARSVEAETLSLTRTGSMIGTPLYMAPEQVTGAAVDPRTDVFALGAVLFHCLTGRPPIRASTLPELVARLTSPDEAPPIRTFAPHVPEALAELVACMLAKDPASRPRDADAVLAALDGRAIEIASRARPQSASQAPPSQSASQAPSVDSASQASSSRSASALPQSASQQPGPQLETADTGIVEPADPGPDFSALVESGRQAQHAGRWAQARAAFEAALVIRDDPEAHAGLGDVL